MRRTPGPTRMLAAARWAGRTARLLGMLGVVLLVAAGAGGYRAGAQDGALADRVRELEARLAAVEANAVPASRRLGPGGTILGLRPLMNQGEPDPAAIAALANPDLVAGPAERLLLVCREYDYDGILLAPVRAQLSPPYAEMVAKDVPSLIGLECGRATAPDTSPPAASAGALDQAPVPARGGLIPTQGPDD